jgi:hypothetical protein
MAPDEFGAAKLLVSDYLRGKIYAYDAISALPLRPVDPDPPQRRQRIMRPSDALSDGGRAKQQ